MKSDIKISLVLPVKVKVTLVCGVAKGVVDNCLYDKGVCVTDWLK